MGHRLRFCLLLSMGLWTAGAATAQRGGTAALPETARSPFVVDTWGIDEGLPQNTVNALLRARGGYLWIGTNGGLVRFDGVRFSVFNRTTTPSLPSDRILALAEDARGTVWVGSQGGGLLGLARDGTTQRFTTRDGLPSDNVGSLLAARDGTLWAGTEGGLARRVGRRFVVETTTSAGAVTTLYEDRDGEVWVGMGAALHRLGAPAETTDVGTRATGLGRGRDGTLWIGTWGGMLRRTARGTELVPGPGGAWQRIAGVDTDAQGRIAATTDVGVLLYDGDGPGYRRLTTAEGLRSNRIRTALFDPDGSLWIGTDDAGLHRVRVPSFRVYPVPSDPQRPLSDVARTVAEDRAGGVWVGSGCNGLARIVGARAERLGPAQGIPDPACVTSVLEDRQGRVWVGFYGDLMVRPSGAARFERVAGWPRGTTAQALYEERDGSLWIGTPDAGLAHLHRGRLAFHTTAHGLPGNGVRAVLAGRGGVLYVATNAGVGRLRGATRTPLTTRDGLSSDDVRALYEDADGGLWIGTYGGGLNWLKNGRLSRFSSADGLPENVVSAIVEDRRGYLWMTGNRGITRVARAAVEAFGTHRRGRLNAHLFGRAAGIPNAETSGGQQPAAWRGADGRFWFPTFSGAAVVDPERLGFDGAPPGAAVEAVRTPARLWSTPGPVRLPLGARQFDVTYTGFDLTNAGQTAFRYRLRGAGPDTAWVEAGTRRVAYFTNVAPGAYSFEVAAASPDGAWSAQPATLALEVPPFVSETAWFRALLLLAVAGLVVGGVHVRVRRLAMRSARLERAVESRTAELREEKAGADAARRAAEEQRGIAEAIRGTVEAQAAELKTLDAAKSRFFANLSHEFRTPLTLIIGPVESAAHDLRRSGQDSLADELATTLQSARRLQRLIDQLLDLARLESRALPFQPVMADLGDFTRELVFAFEGLAEQRGLTLTFQAPETPVRCLFDPDALEKVVFNLVTNAIKFTPPGGRIAVTVSTAGPGGAAGQGETSGVALISVRDTGPGIAADKLPFLFDRFFQVETDHARTGSGIGLALAHELVALHGGQLTVESAVGFGSTFTATLPRPASADAAPGPEVVVARPPAVPDAAPSAVSGAAPVVRPDAATPAPRVDGADASARPDRPVVLLVEDTDEVRAFTRRHLDAHYTIVEATDGRAGLQAAFAHRPHLVITDVMMPEMDGLELCQRLKADPRTALTPVLMLTARASPENRVSGLETGADDYLAKPFVARELQARVENLLRSRAQLQHTYGQTITFAPTGVHLTSADAQFVEEVRAAIEAHIADADFDVQALAQTVGVSYSTLHRRLKELTSQTPGQIVRTMRLTRAAELLEQRVGTVAEAAYATGFNTVSYFARCFREQFGVAPSDYATAREAGPAPAPEDRTT